MDSIKCTIVFFILALVSLPANDRYTAQTLEARFQKVIQKTSPSVVQIRAEALYNSEGHGHGCPMHPSKMVLGEVFLPKKNKLSQVGLGSGFMVEPKGTIITNYHVIEDANQFKIILSDQREIEGEVVGFNQELDIAVIRIDEKYCTPIKWANSSDVKTGAIVFAFGSPFGLQNSVSQGIVSAVGREGRQSNNPQHIQTDVAINIGNSGGPLINLSGRVVGINTWIISPVGVNSGVGFALPSNLAQIAVKNILNGKNEDSWLGVIPHIQKNSPSGVRVLGVIPGSPADKAGIEAGDVLTQYEKIHLDSNMILKELLAGDLRFKNIKLKKMNQSYSLSSKLVKRDDRFDFAIVPKEDGKGNADNEEKEALFQQLSSVRKCSVHEKKSLRDCDNCTTAKSGMSHLMRLIYSDYSVEQIGRVLDAPIQISIWADLTSEKSKKLCSLVEKAKLHFGFLVNVEIRHYPVAVENLSTWGDFVNSYEALRAFGSEYNFYQKLISEPAKDSYEVLEEYLSENPSLLKAVQNIADEDFFRGQILNDMKEGPLQVGIRNAPGVSINGNPYYGAHTEEALINDLKILLMKKSY